MVKNIPSTSYLHEVGVFGDKDPPGNEEKERFVADVEKRLLKVNTSPGLYTAVELSLVYPADGRNHIQT